MEREFVMKRELPLEPNLDQLKNQAKDLLKAHKAGDPEAIQRVREIYPNWSGAKLRLSDAQLVIAREYGFASWPRLKKRVEQSVDPITLLQQAFKARDAARFRELLNRYPQFKARINDPVHDFGSPIITQACTRELIDVLLEAGADINAKSNWWAGGFALVHSAKPEIARYAVERGATVDAHAAARLGMLDKLRDLISADPERVHEKGGDGQTPLHFASTIEIAEYLLSQGADINARDVDHESTPAQYMLEDRQDIARYLVSRGCATDILMAAALGDEHLARQHLDQNANCIHMRVSEEFFPMIGGKSGGTIYQWTLGWHVSAHQVAKKFGHEGIFNLLMERSPLPLKLITACWLGDESLVNGLRGDGIEFSALEQRQVAHAARNNETKSLRLMVSLGMPITVRGQHNATPLHWAAWHGNVEMLREILRRNPPLEDNQNDFNGTPLRWAIHGSANGWHRDAGDYASTVTELLRAGAVPPAKVDDGSEAVQRVLETYRKA
jgi:ankyrin repeat protein